MEKQSTRKFLKLLIALVALFLLAASALMLASCKEHVHQYELDQDKSTNATCNQAGSQTFVCPECGDIYVNVVPATGQHTWEETKVYPASCESEGWTVFTCSVCGTQKQDNWTPKLTHKYEVAETHEATCTTDGYQIFECSFCGDRYTDSQYTAQHPALGHQFAANTDAEDTLEGVDPTAFGYATVEAMKADGWTTVSVANCTTNGMIERKCTREGCDYVDSKIGAQATGHKVLDGGKYVDYEKVCAVDKNLVDVDGNAIYAYECENKNCPVNVVIDSRGTTKHYIEAVEHTYKASTESADGYVAATCEGKGTNVQKCEVCGDIQKTEVPALGHSYNTLRMDGKTEVVVCEKDKDLSREKYLDAMKGYLGVQKYAEMAGTLAQNYKDNTDYSCFCTRCGKLHEATGHEYVVAKLQDGKYGLNDYEKDEEGKPVEAEGVTVDTMDCRYVQVCKNGCGKVLGKGQHGDVVAATCRAGGYCETCGEQVTAQLDHSYVGVATIIGYKDSTNKDLKALYDAYVKVSATESWMQPVKGSCDTASTTVQVCTKCLLDAANGAEFTWSISDKELDTNDPDPAYSASVVESAATHDWQAHYYRLNATSLESGEIVKEQTNCEFGFKLVYKCADCEKVYINTVVGDNLDTKDVNEAKDNTLGEKGVTDANGFILDTSAYTETTIKTGGEKGFTVKAASDLKAAENKGVHALYAVKNYDETNGYVAPNCTTVAQIPFYCTKCGATFVMDANATAEAGKWAYATPADYTAADLVASECVTTLDDEDPDANVDLTNHAGAAFACDDHCKVTDTNGNYICGQLVKDNASAVKDGAIANTENCTKDAAHASVSVEYRLSVDVKYYTGYSLKVAEVPASAIDKDGKIDFSKATLADTTKVSVCHNNSAYEAPKTVATSGNKPDEYLVLVAEDGTVYGLKAFELYTEDGNKTDSTKVNANTKVNQDDIFFVLFTEGTATDAPVAAVNGTSLGMAFGGVAETVGTGSNAKTVLTVNVAQDFTLTASESLDGIIDALGNTVADEYVVDLNGHKITQSVDVQLATSKDLTFTNGTIEFTSTIKGAEASMINPEGAASLTLDGVTLTTKSGSAIYAEDTLSGETHEYPTIVINDSTITAGGSYGVATNAKNNVPDADWEKFSITITDSKISAGTADVVTGETVTTKGVAGTALFINVPSDVTVEGSELTANYQVVVVRGGTLSMTNTKLTLLDNYADADVTTDTYDNVLNSGKGFNKSETPVGNWSAALEGITDVQSYRLAGVWDQGNGIARGAIVVGNSNGNEKAYQNTTFVKFNGITFDIANKDMPKLVVASYYNAKTMGAGTEASPYKTMVTVDATGMGLDASEIDFCFNTVHETVRTIGFVNAD